jgi:glycosyltransferase involved in cell wall biosynthesis
MNPTLSILICSLVSRQAKLDRLLRSLYGQIAMLNDATKVEVLFHIDNKEITTGTKRNCLLDKARGEYIAFIDDDDEVYDNYIRLQLQGCDSGCDCIGSQGHYSINGGNKILWKLSMRYENRDEYENGTLVYYRKANHLSAIKREHALKVKFPDISNAEDKWYSDRIVEHLKSEYVIEEPIYHYAYETTNKQY